MRLVNSVRVGSRVSPSLALASLLLAFGATGARGDLGATRWLNVPIETSSANGPASPFYRPEKASDVFQDGNGVTPPPARIAPALAKPSADRLTVELQAARARKQKAFKWYTRLVTSDERGDVDAALEEYRAAIKEVERLEAATKKGP